jgi:hypothetical protein
MSTLTSEHALERWEVGDERWRGAAGARPSSSDPFIRTCDNTGKRSRRRARQVRPAALDDPEATLTPELAIPFLHDVARQPYARC